MKLFDAKTSSDFVRLIVFIVVTGLATGVLVVMIGNLSFNDTRTYKAVFTDATGVFKGDDVRIAGVKVGSVTDIEIVPREDNPDTEAEDESQYKLAELTFTVDAGTSLPKSTQATIRYRNLVGQRYLSLAPGIGDSEPMEEGDTIQVSQTQPALDLSLLFDGFKPLFQALSPDDVNKLSYEIVQVFQGEGGTLEALLGSTAGVTQELADRDELIGDLLKNLDYVLDHIADRDDQLSSLIVSFRDLVRGLKEDRQAILDSFDEITTLSVETADLVEGIRPPFVEDIKQLRRVTKNIDDNKAELDRVLQVLPIKLEKIGRTAIYGSWFNFYLCDFRGRVRLPGVTVPVNYTVGAERCDLG